MLDIIKFLQDKQDKVPYNKWSIKALEQVQRKATRCIVGKELDYNERLKKIELLPWCIGEILDLFSIYV